MRYGAAISALLHLGILVLVIVGLPSLLQSDRPEIVPVSVEVVSIDELSKKPEKKAPPKPEAPKPVPKKPDPPKVAKQAPPPPAPVPAPPETLKTPEPEPLPPAPKPKPKPELPAPKAEPVPKPKPKPAPPKKAEPPKQPEPQVAAKSPPVPTPKTKPKPPPPEPDAFQSLLKNLAQDKRRAEKAKAAKPEKAAKPVDETPKRSALQARMMAASLAQAVNRQITPCWSIPAGAKDAANMSVAIRIRLNPDGTLGGQPKVEDSARLGRDPFFRAVAESSLRALGNPQCMPLKLPYDQYDLWKEITFVFDPKEALGQ